MLPLEISAADHRAFTNSLATSHSIKITVDVLSMDGDHLTALDPQWLDGQVNFDATADVTRSLTLSILDPDSSLHFDSDSPSDGALYLDRMLKVTYSVNVPTVGWVDVPIFTGPVTKLDRANDIINVECQGKEIIALGPAWHPKTFKKGHLKVNAIKNILKECSGEYAFDFPDYTPRLKHTVSLHRQSQPWLVARRIAHSMDKQLFYDGRGRARLRNWPGRAFEFSDGTGGLVMVPPQISYSTEDIKNTVWVKGGKPRGTKPQPGDAGSDPTSNDKVSDISYYCSAPRSHPLSPQRLGRNGVPRHLLDVIENDKIRSRKEARRVAHSRLDNRLRESLEVTFESLPVPHLEPQDLIRVNTEDGTFEFRLRSYSIPLHVGSNMSVGFNKKVSVLSPRQRRHRRRINQ